LNMRQTTISTAMDAGLAEYKHPWKFRRRGLALVTREIVLAAALSLGVSGPDGNAAPGNAVSTVMLHRWTKQDGNRGLSLVIQVAKTEFRSGEKIEAEILIRNDSREAQRVLVPGLHGRVEYLSTGGRGGDASPADPPMVFGRPAKQDGSDTATLQPGEFIGRKFIFDQARPGEFVVTASYTEKLDAPQYLLVVESAQLKVIAQ
jgi:hypothetical protein